MSKLIVTEIDDHIATLTLNNPEKLNAISLSTWKELASEITRLGQEATLRCIVIRGAGKKAFAAGADIAEFLKYRSNSSQAINYGAHVDSALESLVSCEIPLIAMISGICVGGGLEIACCCDIRISSKSGRFGIPIKQIGHAFALAEMRPVLNLVGPAILLELLLEGQLWDAKTAMSKGLINRVVANKDLKKEVFETAKRVASGAPLAAKMTKKMLKLLISGKKITNSDIKLCYSVCDSRDYREGVRAFLAKEEPIFKGL